VRDRSNKDEVSRGSRTARAAIGLGSGPGRSRGAIIAAVRHSARVKTVRRVFVAASALAVALIFGVGFFDPFGRLVKNVGNGQVGMEGTRITVNHPNISGFQKDGRPFEVKARSGVQDITTPSIVELYDIDSKIGMGDASTLRVTAARGVYDSLRDKMVLEGDARIWSDVGYDVRMKKAEMDFKTGGLVTVDPVNVILKGGTIAANQMDISDNGRKISFVGAVKSIIDSVAGGLTDMDTAAEPPK
jgi:lipopolysaccharide export system protein LptC